MTSTTFRLPERILVPIDLSPRSREGLVYAGMMARRMDGEVILAINVNLPEQGFLEEHGERAGTGQSVEDIAHATLERWAEDALPDVRASTMVAFADYPAEGILAMADKAEADAIVVASHGRSGISRWVLGSVAEQVARSAEVPVIVVPSHEEHTSNQLGTG